ncbi:hypothetical protein F4802DRAFT_567501 [Xylaria palmicola]|nr:hypothetical protein F4802DRAFT_567501 [Xylaria palmicola]
MSDARALLPSMGDFCHGSSDDVTTEPDKRRSQHIGPLTVLEKLGPLSVIALCVAPLTSLLSGAFLILLWTPSVRDSWPGIAATGWLSRSVTLSALVIRVGADSLTAVSVSMLASLVLESRACYLPHLAGISIMRVEAPPPWRLLLKSRIFGNPGHTILLIILSVLSIGLQFSSTILFADFVPGYVPGSPSTVDYMCDLDWGWDTSAPLARIIGDHDIYNSTKYPSGLYSGLFQSAWTQRPNNIPVFGQYRQAVPNIKGVDDSGYVLTALLPFVRSDQRTSVGHFQGPTFVLDSRVSCQRPTFLSLEATPAVYEGGYQNPLWYTLVGRLTNSTDVEGLWFPESTAREIPFACQYKEVMSALQASPEQMYGREKGLGFHICQIQGVNTMMQFPQGEQNEQAILQTTQSAGSLRSTLFPYTVNDPVPARGPAFLVMASNLTLNQNQSEHEAFTKVDMLFTPNSTFRGLPPAVEEVYFSVCYTSWDSSMAHVEMSTPSPLLEPSIEVSEGQLNVDSVLGHYGIGHPSTPRAVLSLKRPRYNSSIGYPIQQPATDRLIAEWDFESTTWGNGYIIDQQPPERIQIVPDPSSDQRFRPLDVFNSWRPSRGNITALFHYQAIGTSDGGAQITPDSTRHPDQSYQVFFTHAMNKTNNSPASSLSALLTFISSSAYYEQFSYLDRKEAAEVTPFVNIPHPQSRTGLSVVIFLVLGHLTTCVCITYLFISNSKLTRLGNAWSTVAQVYGEATKGIIQNGTLTSDRDIEKLLSSAGKARKRVVVSKGGDNGGRVEAVFANETKQSVMGDKQ